MDFIDLNSDVDQAILSKEIEFGLKKFRDKDKQKITIDNYLKIYKVGDNLLRIDVKVRR